MNDAGALDIEGRHIEVTTESKFSLMSRLGVSITGNTQIRLDTSGSRLDLGMGVTDLRGRLFD